MSTETPIRVTAHDPETGETGVQEIVNDYCLVTAGTCQVTNVTAHANGTHVVTIKGVQRAGFSS